MNIALPSFQKVRSFDDGNRQWFVTAYALAFGSLLLLGGRIADLVGRHRFRSSLDPGEPRYATGG